MKTAEPRDTISEITEIGDTTREDITRAFFASLGWSALAGTLVLVSLMIVFSPDPSQGLVQAIMGGLLFVGFFATILTLAGMIAIVLPVTLLLKLLGLEYRAIYIALGAAFGFAVMATLFEVWRWPSAEMFTLPAAGAMAGIVCGYRWGGFRERVGKRSRHDPPQRQSTNPFHDMIH